MANTNKTPRLIPVVDVMHGRAVRAVGGRREDYQPIACPFTSSRNAHDVANALIQLVGTDELYVADLDAITGKSTASSAVEAILANCLVPIWLDAGFGRDGVFDLPSNPNARPVVGSETCRRPKVLSQALAETCVEPHARPVAFSIDLKAGHLLGDWQSWGLAGPHDVLNLARRVIEMGVQTLIVLDLARVGSGSGAGTEPLLRAIRNEFPEIDLIAGGGVRGWDDVERLGEAGATGVLVASALHDGTLTRPRPTS